MGIFFSVVDGLSMFLLGESGVRNDGVSIRLIRVGVEFHGQCQTNYYRQLNSEGLPKIKKYFLYLLNLTFLEVKV